MCVVVELNLAKSGVTNAGLETIGQMTNLTHLHLNNTGITDASLEHLINLYQLEYLNLYGTAITDNGLLALRKLKNLKKVFLWETAVSKEAVAELHKSVFGAVESENLRLQIQELSKRRDNLDVDIVSTFDFDLEPVEEKKEEEVSDPEISISDVMINFHKGKNSIAAQAQEGKADKDILQEMLSNYRAISELTPPKGSVEDWKKRTAELTESANNLLLFGSPDAIERYKAAVNCKACHSEHRTD